MVFNTTFEVNDEYFTPKSAWEAIKDYIPKDKVIWEAFYGNGSSGKYLEDLGFNVIHENLDFFTNNLGDIIISNPPFSKTKEIFLRLKELDKPFILIMPDYKIHTNYFREMFDDGQIQILIPRRRIQFKEKGSCSFDCFYYCWKMNLKKDIIFLT
jgi:hypothetical protein